MHSVTSQDGEEDDEADAREEMRIGLAGNCRQDKDEENEEGCGRGRAGTTVGLRWQIAVLWKFLAVESMPNALNNIPQPSLRGSRIKWAALSRTHVVIDDLFILPARCTLLHLRAPLLSLSLSLSLSRSVSFSPRLHLLLVLLRSPTVSFDRIAAASALFPRCLFISRPPLFLGGPSPHVY